jgi:hypothetical protein
MKNNSTCLMIVCLLTIMSVNVTAASKPGLTVSANRTSGKLEASAVLERLNVIKTMDKSHLSSSEKSQLRSEVSGIKSQLKELDGGIYLSVGAIIIILLLLILLL